MDKKEHFFVFWIPLPARCRLLFVVSAFFEAGTGFYVLYLVNTLMASDTLQKQMVTAGFFFLLVVGNAVLKWRRKKAVIQIAWARERALYEELANGLFSSRHRFMDMEEGKAQGLLMARVQAYRDFLMNHVENLAYWPLVFVFSLMAMLVIDWKISVLIVVCVFACALINRVLTARMPKASHAYYEKQDALFQLQKELAEQRETIALSNMETAAMEQYTQKSAQTLQAETELLQKHRDAYIPGLLNEYLPTFLFMAILIVYAARIDVAQAVALMGLTGSISLPLSQFFRSCTVAKRQEPFLQTVERCKQGRPLPVYVPCAGALFAMEDVRFTYPNMENGLTIPKFVFRPGEKIAITGASGAGKSTFVSLLLGMQSAQSGTVQSVYDDPVQGWKHGAYVDGGHCVFDGTVLENITFQTKLESPEQKQRYEHLLAQLRLEANESDSALCLSGGQKQKIALARALFAQPDFLIFDEPLAAMDAQSEHDIIELLRQLPQAMLIISHRPDIWSICERRYDIKEGKVYETARSC
ncbi:ABC transporter ATP-binding protein [uncultured Dubosiella sp.]|uniref:ATP-binding cassette domain-containing protein n=1 Tax=uncultured Dubosiella sp. TaxID=1937011 RepID=UPI0025B4DB83|nr:ABC transporter ATP-binding protein [uncultured Dubosiella sp.]